MPADAIPHRTWVELDRNALRHNLAVAKTYATADGGVMAVVKADAYGLGAGMLVPELESMGADSFGVATLAEAWELRKLGVRTPIYLLSPALPDERAAVVAGQGGLIPAVSSIDEAVAYSALATAAATTQAIHLVVDTGMGRIGLLETEAVSLAIRIAALPGLEIDSVASHFPSADEDADFTAAQLVRYHALLHALAEAGLAARRHHVANSAATFSQPRLGSELVRAGLMLCGVSPFPNRQHELRPVVTWRARVLLVRTLPPGHGISYGRTFQTDKLTRVATLAVGYADGYPRLVSGNGAWVWLGSQPCRVLGRVTMDQIMVEASDSAQPGDVATLMGADGPSATELARRASTIPHDIFCGLGARVARLLT